MATKRTEHSRDPWALTQADLQQLLAQKEKEADVRLARELTERCAQVRFQETLSAHWASVTDLFELADEMVQGLRRTLGGQDVTLAVVTDSQFLEVIGSTQSIPSRYHLELIEEAFIVGETMALAGEDAADLCSIGNVDLPPGIPQLAVPFFGKDGKPLGVLFVEGELHPDKADWLPNFTALVSQALEDCLHYNLIEQMIADAVMAIATASESKVPNQAGHLKRVSDLCRQMSQTLGLSPTMSKRVQFLAMLHDMTPEEVHKAFNSIKRGQLTAQQWKDLMAEPFQGGIFPSPLADFQSVVEELAYMRCRWDGKANEPDVRGEEIPLAARIVAVAEAFEHLTGRRQYRTTLPIPKALAQICRLAGEQYDPAVVDALCHQFATVELETRITTMWSESYPD